ncbi:phosphate ABC transporter permease subunit PstC [Ferrimonas lipolytica]|uniref:Phosphate transport system permease protein n=1 Tax=Ferrimonas lipolytica TaxID=2724191 RepID=A0A6H1UAR2_9GAMM|nr:phosphate ABC transporter permease subunit PstC [Ferrimonas lipolytica]QIZ76141.1 phosphate ABC transporter permease subunit PstC [Ferrimonas lipolytica]
MSIAQHSAESVVMRDALASSKKNEYIEQLFHGLFLLSAFIGVASVTVIGFFLIKESIPVLGFTSIDEILFGTEWLPPALYGIAPMIVGTLMSTAVAIAIGVPIGLLTAVFLAEIAPDALAKLMRPAVELLAGIPSVVYGFFGLVVIVPLIEQVFEVPSGATVLAGSVVLAVMILPTVIAVSETSIRALPSQYKEGSLALGASKIYTIFNVLIPAARSGILTGIILGIARAIGETMAIIMVMGNAPAMPEGILESARSLTANIALEMSYATGVHASALYATGVVLLIFVMMLNGSLMFLNRKRIK